MALSSINFEVPSYKLDITGRTGASRKDATWSHAYAQLRSFLALKTFSVGIFSFSFGQGDNFLVTVIHVATEGEDHRQSSSKSHFLGIRNGHHNRVPSKAIQILMKPVLRYIRGLMGFQDTVFAFFPLPEESVFQSSYSGLGDGPFYTFVSSVGLFLWVFRISYSFVYDHTDRWKTSLESTCFSFKRASASFDDVFEDLPEEGWEEGEC